jgi:leucyl aminopeptidase
LAEFTGRTTFDPVPSVESLAGLKIEVVDVAPDDVALAVFIGPDDVLPARSPIEWNGLRTVGFEANAGQTAPLPTSDGGKLILVGVGEERSLSSNALRDLAAALSRATASVPRLAIQLPAEPEPTLAAQMIVEGVVLARYRYRALKKKATVAPLEALTLVTGATDEASRGAARGRAMADATQIARDLANTPPALLTPTQFAEAATRLGSERGLEVEIFDKEALVAMGCGGILGVNAGSAEPPTLIKLTYVPDGAPTGTPDARGEGDHLRRRGTRTQAGRRGPCRDEERHVGCRRDPGRDAQPGALGLHPKGDRISLLH